MERVYKIRTPYSKDYVHVDAPHLQCPHIIHQLVCDQEGWEYEDITVEDVTHEFHSLQCAQVVKATTIINFYLNVMSLVYVPSTDFIEFHSKVGKKGLTATFVGFDPKGNYVYSIEQTPTIY